MQIHIIMIVVFAATLLSFLGIYYGITLSRGSVKSAVRRRLQSISKEVSATGGASSGGTPSILKSQLFSEVPSFNKMLYQFSPARKMQKLIEQSDTKLSVGVLILLTALLFCVGLLGCLIIHRGVLLGVILGVVLAFMPYVFLSGKVKKRLRKFTEQFPDALDMMALSLRAGHSFVSAMQIVYQESSDPVAKLFKAAYDEQNFGLPLSDALDNMTTQMPSMDLEFFVTSVNIQKDTGGNLAEILEKLGVTIRERLKIYRQLRVYTAQGRMSGYILAALPVVLVLVIMFINPAYFAPLLKTKTGLYMVITALSLQVIGFFIIRRIIAIKV